jgi:hypothetical protein
LLPKQVEKGPALSASALYAGKTRRRHQRNIRPHVETAGIAGDQITGDSLVAAISQGAPSGNGWN